MRIGAGVVLNRDGSINRRTLLRVAAQATAAFGAGRWTSASAQPAPMRIGWVWPMTGRLTSSFAPLYVGGKIAVDEINAAGGIFGRPIARAEEDDEASPAKEPGLIRKLRGQEIGIVIGPTGSSQALASIAATTPARMIQASYSTAAEAVDSQKYT